MESCTEKQRKENIKTGLKEKEGIREKKKKSRILQYGAKCQSSAFGVIGSIKLNIFLLINSCRGDKPSK